jgi:outer membrane protein assembly factor BamB
MINVKRSVRLLALGLALKLGGIGGASLWAADGAASSWPSFRGADRTAVSAEKGLLQTWPEAGPKLLWESKGAGRGYASLAIAGGRIITLGDGPSTAEDKEEYLSAFSLSDGKPLWKVKTGSPWNSGAPDWQGSRSTPTIDGDLVYVITPFGTLLCCDAATGAEKWRKDLKKDFGGDKGDGWGYSESPLIDGPNIICTPGKEANTMVALNKLTGEKVWSCSRKEDRGAGHASIVAATVGGVKVYVTTTASGAMGVRANDGKLLWTYDIDRTTAVIPTPIIRGDLVFFTAGYRRGGALLKQVASGQDVKVEEVYGLKTDLANKHGGVVLVGDYLYGDSDDQGIPFCANLMTGEVAWKKRGSGKGSASVIAADGCLYIRFSDGKMVLAKANNSEYVEVGSFKLPGNIDKPGWSHPVLLDGKLYLREQDRLLCFDVKSK